MRIISGSARGKQLVTLDGEHTRPTLERVKEGVFSAVQFWVPGARVLDLFAGSGQLGLEALSRGAAHCTFVENDAKAHDILRKNVENTGLSDKAQMVKTDAIRFLATTSERYDLILLDPPYDSGFLPDKLPEVALICAKRAEVICESDAKLEFPSEIGGLCLKKQYKYGTVKVSRYIIDKDEG